MKPPIPLSILRDLKCHHCSEVVSCGPVFVTPSSGVLCGRCNPFAIDTYRNHAFEAIAQNFTFPCRFWTKYCSKQLPWEQSLEHEEHCTYRNGCLRFCLHSPTACATRSFPTRENFPPFSLDEIAIRKLRCYQCLQVINSEPVYIDPSGSNICHRCSSSSVPPAPIIRNLAYEKIANIVLFPCTNSHHGCSVKLRFGKRAWIHETECAYNPHNTLSSNSFGSKDFIGKRSPMHYHFREKKESNKEINVPVKQSPIYYHSRDDSQESSSTPRQSNSSKKHAKHQDIEDVLTRSDSKSSQSSRQDSERAEVIERRHIKGVVPTHSGHIYATLTQHSILFAPPENQKDRNIEEQIEFQREYQEVYNKKHSYVKDNIKVSTEVAFYHETRHRPTLTDNDLSKSELLKLAPSLEDYVKQNPQNVQKEPSFRIGNQELIDEIKSRQRERATQNS